MRLYTAATTEYARHVIDEGFVGVPRVMYDAEAFDAVRVDTPEGEIRPPDRLPEPIGVSEYCEFRDIPPAGLTFSRTTEAEVSEGGDEDLNITISGGPTLADDPGDFVLSIEVPDDIALKHEAREDPPPGWPFREFWLPPELANNYRDTLKVIDSGTGEEVRPDLVGR